MELSQYYIKQEFGPDRVNPADSAVFDYSNRNAAATAYANKVASQYPDGVTRDRLVADHHGQAINWLMEIAGVESPATINLEVRNGQ